MRNRFSEELALVLKRKDGYSQSEVAKKTFYSESTISRIVTGLKKADPQTRWTLANVINDLRLSYTAASESYGTISFQRDRKRKDDVFSALVKQRTEQGEREKLEPEFETAITTEPRFRTPEQNQVIERYPREYIEEISAEITALIEQAEYAGIPMNHLQQVIDEVNDSTGG
ncbi:helix-turn-helix domain-containing protein [Lactiplantibacillus modestisalitolerans]|uniref:Transcriptional regulator n=1 Tax=Lactiplantibacillus modestisalitolerans TaxID=1457219 RepID=A0ABV5WVF5_9LACO|nr:helix-turn-helix transcriptional regulator [Lactiplantibacillus modestisalitolerans]